MKERPILFSGPMVRAILEGRKTQTRRVWKLPSWAEWDSMDGGESAGRLIPKDPAHRGWYSVDEVACPYGQPGDRLWVREAWSQPTTLDPGPTFYRANYPECVPAHFENVPPADQIKWKPSIHMPRRLSRITLEITGVRVERLQDISEADARAEGVADGGCLNCGNPESCGCADPRPDARDSFCRLWQSINGEQSWHANPWVWVVEFRRIAA